MRKKLITLPLLFIVLFIAACGDSDRIIQGLMDISGAPLEYDDSKATKHLNVASVCMSCSRDKQENLQKMTGILRRIKTEKPATRLVVFGETILGWYYDPVNPVAYQKNIAETIPGPATDKIGALADSLNMYIAFGLTERSDEGENFYNSLVLLNPKGEIEAVHSKVSLINWDEKSGFTPGKQKTVVTIDGIKTGMIICSDIQSVKLVRELVGDNIKIIIHALASDALEFRIDAVARQFNAWAIIANRCGDEEENSYSGNCYIADPAGTIRVGGQGIERVEYYRIGVYE